MFRKVHRASLENETRRCRSGIAPVSLLREPVIFLVFECLKCSGDSLVHVALIYCKDQRGVVGGVGRRASKAPPATAAAAATATASAATAAAAAAAATTTTISSSSSSSSSTKSVLFARGLARGSLANSN